MVSVRDGRPFFTPLTTIITAGLEAVIAAAMEKSCQNTIKFQTTVRERAEKVLDGSTITLPGLT